MDKLHAKNIAQNVNTETNEARAIVTYKNQSTAMMSPMSSSGKPTACSTMIVVIEPADGIPAAPIAMAVAVRLYGKTILFTRMYHVVIQLQI